jgi:hypothetical protein
MKLIAYRGLTLSLEVLGAVSPLTVCSVMWSLITHGNIVPFHYSGQFRLYYKLQVRRNLPLMQFIQDFSVTDQKTQLSRLLRRGSAVARLLGLRI